MGPEPTTFTLRYRHPKPEGDVIVVVSMSAAS